MGRISDIIPSLYYQEPNNLIKFVNVLDVEVDFLEKQVAGITDLINVDKCPDDKLVYLAALTNCPLIGNDPILWRRQIKNWPYLLKMKGTELSLDIFLNSIGATVHNVRTFFKDEAGNLTENVTPIRSHMFDLDITWEDKQFVNWYEWDNDFASKIKIWIERVKPFHAELRRLTSIIPVQEQKNLFAGIASGLSGFRTIKLDRPEAPKQNKFFFAPAQGLSGNRIINISRPNGDKNKIYYGIGTAKFRAISLGVDLDTMQELLQRFEDRIFARLEQHEQQIMTEFNTRQQELKLELEDIKELLRWEDGDVV